MAGLEFHQFTCRKDNYGVLVHDSAANMTASIDAPDAAAVTRELALRGWTLTHILTTHHHADHTAGNLEIKSATGCRIIGPEAEAARVPGIDDLVGEGARIRFGGQDVHVLETPGHTAGHVSYHFATAGVAFVGDTLFAMGCGRVLEGSYEMMWGSLRKIAALPSVTRLYCGHEYTLANARFGLTIEPDNVALQRRAAEVESLRATDRPTLPTQVALERETNVFLRPHVYAIRERLNMRAAADWRVFKEMRERKNKA